MIPYDICLLSDLFHLASSCNARVLGLIPGLGRSPGGGHAAHFSIPSWRMPMDRGAWQDTTKRPSAAHRIISGSIQCCCKWHHCSFLWWVILHCIYAPRLYPFICWWTFRLLPCPVYCKQSCNEHWAAGTFLKYGFLQIQAPESDWWVIR